MYGFRIYCCLLLLLSSGVCGAAITPDEKEFYFRHVRTEQGLTNGLINDLLRDREGFLWIATLNGLNCYDGSHCLTWKANPGDSTQLMNEAIYALCEDTNGNVWCTNDAGISLYDRSENTFSNYQLFNKVTGERAAGYSNGIVCTRKGEIVTYTNKGIYIFDRTGKTFTQFPENIKEGSLDADQINNQTFIEDPFRNGIWMGTDKGLKYFDLDKRIFYSYRNNPEHNPVFNNNFIRPVTLDRNKNLVFGDNEDQVIRTYSFSTGALTELNTVPWTGGDIFISSILADRDGNFWVSADGSKTFFYDASRSKVFLIRHRNETAHSIAGDHFEDAIQDSMGTIWLGTVNGLSYMNPYNDFISVYRMPDTVSHAKRYYLHQLLNADYKNCIWMAPMYDKLLKYDLTTQIYTQYDIIPEEARKKYGENILISAMEPTAEKLYFGTMDGVYVYEYANDKFTRLNIPEKEALQGKYMLAMLLARNGELWFTSHHNGVFCYNTLDGSYKHFIHDSTDASSFSDQYVFDIGQDNSGEIWFCIEKDGLVKYDRSSGKFVYDMRDLKNKDSFYSMSSDSKNNLWLMGFLTGLNKFNTKTHALEKGIHFDGLSNFRYNHLVCDKGDRLWLSYYTQYSMVDLNANRIRNFEVDMARSGNDYANFSCVMPDGRIVTESRNSFFVFDPVKAISKNPVGTITISAFTAGKTVLPFVPDGKLTLSSDQNYFSVNFSTLSDLGRNEINYAYKLDGFSDEWIDCGQRQTAYFTNIPGGDYVFRVRARNNDGEWTEASSPLRVNVKKVFYATLWFKLLLFAMLVVCVAWYIRFLKRRALKREADKAINYFVNSMQGRNKVEELLWDITHNVITRTDLVDCVVYLLDEERQVLVQKAAYGDKNPSEYEILNPIEIKVGEGIVGAVALTGVTEVIGDTSKDPRYISDDAFRYSELAVPILNEGKVIAVIDSEHPKKNFFTAEHIQLMQNIASISGTKIMNAQKEMAIIENEKRMDDLRMQISQARQKALQAQMNPHFIFNCLNSINGFILKNDAATASTFLIKFSKLIRLILEHSNEKSISLQSELDALRLYIEMEALRFEKKFTYTIEVDPTVSTDLTMVPPLILQPFVENSIWHGLLLKETEGRLHVHIGGTADMLECTIEDNGVGREKSAAMKSNLTSKKSLGMKLTKERLALLNQQDHAGSSVQVFDLVDPEGHACGTKVVLSIAIPD